MSIQKSRPQYASTQEAIRSLSRDINNLIDYIDISNVFTITTSTSTKGNGVYLCDASSGAITITLPAAGKRHQFHVKKTDSVNTVTISGGTIDGDTSLVISAQYDSARLMSDGTNWFII